METEEGRRITIPFTYRIKCPDGQSYYGVRYANGCNPSDLWNTYFTSSKEIKKLLEIHHKDEFIFEVRKIFETIDSALQFEARVLKRIVGKSGWINKCYSDMKFKNIGPHTDETKYKIARSLTGHKQSEETVNKRVKKLLGKTRTEESKRKSSQSTKAYWKDKERIPWNKGKKHSEETIKKLKEVWKPRVPKKLEE